VETAQLRLGGRTFGTYPITSALHTLDVRFVRRRRERDWLRIWKLDPIHTGPYSPCNPEPRTVDESFDRTIMKHLQDPGSRGIALVDLACKGRQLSILR
jgi:hypothetical protein